MNGRMGRGLSAIALVITLTGCTAGWVRSDATWETYNNDRFGFAFLYPSDWIAAPPPTNLDGQAFVHPQSSDIQMRGWAGYRVREEDTLPDTNFTTQQGLEGMLTVAIGDRVSTMTLELVRDDIIYTWQAQAPTAEFSDYYRLFDYIARQYRVVQQ